MASVGGSIGWARNGVSTRGIAQRVGDGRLRDAGDGDDVAGLGEVDGGALQAAEGQHLGDARRLDQRSRRGAAP